MTPDQATAYLAVMDAKLHPPPPLNPTTPSEARQRLDALISNKQWAANWIAGGIVPRPRNMPGSAELADQADQVTDAISNDTTPEPNLIETVGPDQLSTTDLASAVEMFRDAGLTDDVINQGLRGGEVSEVSRAEVHGRESLEECAARR